MNQLSNRVRQLCLTNNLTYLDTLQQDNNKIIATIHDNEDNKIYIYNFIYLMHNKDINQIKKQLEVNQIIFDIVPNKILECKRSNDFAYIKKEFVSGKSLKQLFNQQQYFTIEDIFYILFCILKQLQQMLKTHKIIHCNIKPENIILIDQQFINQYGYKSCCFYKYVLIGFSNAQELVFKEQKFYERLGDISLQSPEMQKYKGYNSKTDVWSLGKICYNIINETQWLQKTLKLIIQNHNLKSQYDKLQCIIQSMIQQDQEQRWDIEQCLKYILQNSNIKDTKNN